MRMWPTAVTVRQSAYAWFAGAGVGRIGIVNFLGLLLGFAIIAIVDRMDFIVRCSCRRRDASMVSY
jgi:hypothetical protein